MPERQPFEIAPEQLRWVCDPASLGFETTEQVDPASRIIGQETAHDALLFGLQSEAPGQNIYVRGSRGTGRLTLVLSLLENLQLTTDNKRDICYVHNFKNPDRPRLVTLRPGSAKAFKRRISELASFIQEGLVKALDAEPFVSQRADIKEQFQQKIASVSEQLEKELQKNSMALHSIQQGNVSVPVIVPLVDGQPVDHEQFQQLIKEGKASEEQLEKFKELYPGFQKRMHEVGKLVNEVYQEGSEALSKFNESAARDLFGTICEPLLEDFGSGRGVRQFVGEIVDDAVENRLVVDDENRIDLTELYGVNILLTHSDASSRPIVEESLPNIMNLLGTVEQKFGPGGVAMSDYRGIRPGALLNADQGFLILNVDDLSGEPGAWHALMRTLRTRRLEIVPPETGWMRPYVVVQPEPIDIHVRVILIGDVYTYYMLDRSDPEFKEQFKVLADFDDQLTRNEASISQYAAVISHLAKHENTEPFAASAVAALVEHGARIASRSGKLTAKFRRIADIAREAAFVASQNGESPVLDTHIIEAIQRTKRRASMPSQKFQELVERGTIIVQTTGEVVGQINGLAVMQAGPLTYGFPARITASIGPGRAGLINIEGFARMSGSIHTKGFHILGGLLRHLLKLSHPLAFSASLAFEQSYGGIDGDSASGAEMVCLLSALTGIPVRQGMAMTGAIDQHGHLEAIGGVNEKIEGYYDACAYFGLNGDQGVVIPQANAGDLMLRRDIVEACSNGKFHVYAVSTIHEAIELMTGVPAGEYEDGQYPDGSLLQVAVDKATDFWRRTLSSPSQLTTVKRDEIDSPIEPEPMPGMPLTEEPRDM